MTRFLLLSVLLHAGPATVRAQEPDIEIPSVTPKNFSQLAGKYRLTSSATPAEVQVEQPITLKVQIVGQGPAKYHPTRKLLQIFPDELADDFHLESVEAEDKLLPEKGLWEFVYRLRPKRAGIDTIPGLRLVYYSPASNKFQTSFADEIPIVVKPPAEPTPDKLELKVVPAPPGFYQLAPLDEVMRDATPWPSPPFGVLAVILAAPPILCFVWYRLWRRLHPTAQEHRDKRRSRAARLAIHYLEKQTPGPAQTAAALADFLRQRLDFPAQEPTPDDVARHLRRLGVNKKLTADWAEFLQACDRSRFALSPDAGEKPLPAGAIRLIHALEAEPCVSR